MNDKKKTVLERWDDGEWFYAYLLDEEKHLIENSRKPIHKSFFNQKTTWGKVVYTNRVLIDFPELKNVKVRMAVIVDNDGAVVGKEGFLSRWYNILVLGSGTYKNIGDYWTTLCCSNGQFTYIFTT